MRTFFYTERPSQEDERRCRVCGHLSLTPARRTLNAVLLIVIGMLIGYIVLDIAQDGTLDGSIFRVIHEERTHAEQGAPPPRR